MPSKTWSILSSLALMGAFEAGCAGTTTPTVISPDITILDNFLTVSCLKKDIDTAGFSTEGSINLTVMQGGQTTISSPMNSAKGINCMVSPKKDQPYDIVCSNESPVNGMSGPTNIEDESHLSTLTKVRGPILIDSGNHSITLLEGQSRISWSAKKDMFCTIKPSAL